MRMPVLETERLQIRPFIPDDLEAAYRILDVELADADTGTEGLKARADRERWLRWASLNHEELARMYQPPYGDRALVLRENDLLVGACGYVPCFAPFAQIPALDDLQAGPGAMGRYSTEFGLYWAISPHYQRRGYATEAARALIGHAFGTLGLGRIVATTSHDNGASIAVMRKLGMRIERNPYPEPAWLQIVGVLQRP